MVSDLATKERLAAAAEGSVRAEGLSPSAQAKELVAEMVRGSRSAEEVRRELIVRITPIVEQKLPKATAFDPFQKLLGHELVRVDIAAVHGNHKPGVFGECLHFS